MSASPLSPSFCSLERQFGVAPVPCVGSSAVPALTSEVTFDSFCSLEGPFGVAPAF